MKALRLSSKWDGQKLSLHFKPHSINEQSMVQIFVSEQMGAASLEPVSNSFSCSPKRMTISFTFAAHDWQRADAFGRKFEGRYMLDAAAPGFMKQRLRG